MRARHPWVSRLRNAPRAFPVRSVLAGASGGAPSALESQAAGLRFRLPFSETFTIKGRHLDGAPLMQPRRLSLDGGGRNDQNGTGDGNVKLIGLFGILFATSVSSGCLADQAQVLGFARLFSNDFLGDGHDRWRTGSFVMSQLRGPADLTGLPTGPGHLVEFRFRTEIIAPRKLSGSGPFDRPYAGILSLGLHTHFEEGNTEYSLGADLVAVGESTGLSSLQRVLHETLLGDRFSSFAPELDDAVYPTALVEIARRVELSDLIELRPFVEAQAGVETFLRIGGDVTFGKRCRKEIRARDVTTGFRYRAASCPTNGQLEGVAGTDVAYIFDSKLLPSSFGVVARKVRPRVRIGLRYSFEHGSIFYGLTWLGKEFEGQRSGQLTGSMSLSIRF